MKQDRTVYLIAGGDRRQVHLAGLLAADSPVYVVGFSDEVVFPERVGRLREPEELPCPADIVVFPVPALDGAGGVNTPLSDGVPLSPEQVLDCAAAGGLVLGGKLNAGLVQNCKSRGLRCADYMEREELAVLNAVPTAEGAVAIAMQELPTALFGQKCLITGFGRIAKVLTHHLLALGMEVTVAARKYSDFAWITIYGAEKEQISRMGERLGQYDLIINTVPARLFDRELLSGIHKGCPLIDLASAPGGVNLEAAKELGVKVIRALSLPGKVAPVTAGQIICDTIHNILSETEG